MARPSECNVLQERTTELLENRARLHCDLNFLQHFAQVAQQSAIEQRTNAKITTEALNNNVGYGCRSRQQLWMLRQEWLSAQADVLSARDAEAAISSSTSQLKRQAADEIGRLRSLIVAEDKLKQTASQEAQAFRRAVEAAKGELESVAREAQKQKEWSERAEAALEQVHAEAHQRETLLQEVLQQTLRRLEADFARERAAHDACEYRFMAREFANNTSTSVQAYDSSINRAAAASASSRSASASTDLLADVRQDLGLPEVILQDTSGKVSRDVVEVAPSPLEAEVTKLRRSQEALEEIWADKAWKHRGILVQNHIAALAERAGGTPLANAASAEASAASSERGLGLQMRAGSDHTS
jgi:hypothetical protein